jgi:hypothetical protein
MLKAAQQAGDDFTLMQRIAFNAIGLSQAFPAIAHATRSNQEMALPSQAETTLSWYSPWGGRPTESAAGQGMRTARPLACYGCRGPHPWSEYQQGSYVIICPNQNNQGIKENAARALERMSLNKSKRYQHNKKCKNLLTVNFSDLPEATKAWMQGSKRRAVAPAWSCSSPALVRRLHRHHRLVNAVVEIASRS